MTKKRWIDRFVKQFTRRCQEPHGFAKEDAKVAAEVSYQEYGNTESDNYDKDCSPEDSADEEFFAMYSDT